MRNYSDNKIVATRGIGLPDLLHQGGGLGGLGSTLPVTQIQPAPAVSARAAHGPTAFRIEVMRDGKSSEAMSFVHSAWAADLTYQTRQEDAPAISEPPMPPMPVPPDAPAAESPVSAARPVWSASFAEPPPSAFATVRDDAINGASGNQRRAAQTRRSGLHARAENLSGSMNAGG